MTFTLLNDLESCVFIFSGNKANANQRRRTATKQTTRAMTVSNYMKTVTCSFAKMSFMNVL